MHEAYTQRSVPSDGKLTSTPHGFYGPPCSSMGVCISLTDKVAAWAISTACRLFFVHRCRWTVESVVCCWGIIYSNQL